jgi:UrcA family protein
MMIKSAFAAVAAAAAILAAPATAQSQAELVSYADLDLTTAQGRAELEERVERAAWRVCKLTEDGAMRSRIDTVRCFRGARQKSAPLIAAASQRQQRERTGAA